MGLKLLQEMEMTPTYQSRLLKIENRHNKFVLAFHDNHISITNFLYIHV